MGGSPLSPSEKPTHPVRNTLADPDRRLESAEEGEETVVSWRCSADDAAAASRARRGFKRLFACFTLDLCFYGAESLQRSKRPARKGFLWREDAEIRPVQKGKAYTVLDKPASIVFTDTLSI